MVVASVGVLTAFGGGMLSFLSPCVLPLVPGYLSLMSGVSVAELEDRRAPAFGRVVRATLLFVAGFTLVFVALGATASTVGTALQHHRRVLDEIAGVLIIAMGVFLAGFVSPRLLMVERRMHVSPSALGSWAPPVMGMAFAFGWTPCIGPILAGVLAEAAAHATLSRGVLLLVAYSLGLGVPFIVTGAAFGRLAGVFSWVKRHFRVINLVAGVALIVFGLLLVTHRVFWLSVHIQRWMDDLHLDWLSRI